MNMPEVVTINCPGPIESRWRERLRFRLLGVWSPRVVEERMAEHHRVQQLNQLHRERWLRDTYERCYRGKRG